MSNIGNVVGGHKANLSNPNTSEKSKQHSLEVIEKATGTEVTSGAGATAHTDDGKDPMRVAAGLKAALHNPNVSDETKDGVKVHLDEVTHTAHADDGKDATRVTAGLKSALHNDNVSEEAKEHVKERLADMQ